MASLTIVVDGVEQKYPLENAAVTLGRGLESDIRLKDIKASRRHCQIVRTPKGYQCVDLSSGNGTYVNGVQIKTQMLDSGDKITIGSTTIAFDDPKAAPARAAVPKAPTAKLPVVPAPAPAPLVSTKSPTAKIPTERVLAAPTRKATARVEAVKVSSQAALKPPSQSLQKTGSRLQRTTGRAPGARAPRPPAEAPKKRNPVLLAGIAAFVLILGAGGYFLFGSRDNGDQISAQIKALVGKAEAADKAERFADAVQDYKKALDLCQGERYKVRASEITKALAQIEARRGSGAATPPRPEPKDAPEKGPDFGAKQKEIADRHKLSGDPSGADWSGAMKEWADFLKGKLAADAKAKAEAEVKALAGKARQDLDRLRKKAEALAQENKMAEALDLLKQQKPRFAGTALEADLNAAINLYDK